MNETSEPRFQFLEGESRVQTICLLTLTFIFASGAVYWLRPVLLPFVVAVFIVTGIQPILRWVESRLGTQRMMAAAITFLFGCLLLVMMLWALWLSIADLATFAPVYEAQVTRFVEQVSGWFDLGASESAGPQEAAAAGTEIEGDAVESSTDSAVDAPHLASVPKVGMHARTSLLERALRNGAFFLIQELSDLLSGGVIALIYVYFLLLGAPSTQLTRPELLARIEDQIRSYLVLKTLISAVTGLVFGVTLWWFGVPMAFAFGTLAFLLNFIPNIGPLIASALPIPFILFHPEATVWWIVLVIGLTVAIQFLSGNVIEPQVMGDSSDLHPITILLGLMFWGMIWGILGMFLATLIMAGIKIALERMERTRPLAELMAGRWQPEESSPVA